MHNLNLKYLTEELTPKEPQLAPCTTKASCEITIIVCSVLQYEPDFDLCVGSSYFTVSGAGLPKILDSWKVEK